MTDKQLAEIKARCEAAKPGAWEWKVGVFINWCGKYQTRSFVMTADKHIICDFTDIYSRDNLSDADDDAEFIAHAREDVPALLAEVERLRAREKWLIKQLAMEGAEWYCPMPYDYECKYRNYDLCKAKSSKHREQCWRMAADMVTLESLGKSGDVQESEQNANR